MMISRKKMLKFLAGIPLLGAAAGCGGTLSSTDSTRVRSRESEHDLFRELGVKPIINGRGTLTYLSGSLMLPEVIDAMSSTSRQFANINEVQDKVGERIARLLNCEAAMVTSGAAAAMTLGTAAAITGKDEEKIRLLPNLPGPKREVIIQKTHRFPYDHAVRNTGVKMVEVGSVDEMERLINKRTVMALFFNAANEHCINKEEFIAICKQNGVPSFNDAAADVPPVSNLFRYIEMGFDLVAFSGGKAMRGPQSTGLLFGRKDLIEAAKLNHSPNADTIGRGMKVNKEEMFGMLVALEIYLSKDHEQEWQEWIDRTKRIAAAVEAMPTVKGETYINPGPANHFPGLRIRWDQSRIKITPPEVVELLRNGDPSIEIAGNEEMLNISVVMMEPGHVDITARRLKEVLEMAV